MPPGLSALKISPFLYVKLFAFAVDRLPAVPLSHVLMRTLIDLITAAALVALAWLAAVAILSL